jgi:CheY-like chemotaxis protein
MDLQMPKMNGFETTKTLRQGGFKNPIIAVTASHFQDEWQNCIDAGIDDLLLKPIKKSAAAMMLEKWIGHKTNQQPLSTNKNLPPKSSEKPEKTCLAKPIAFDLQEMLDTFMNNEEIVVPLLSRFIERTKIQIENIPILKEHGDWGSARLEAHTIKGAAKSLGGAELGDTAYRLETACKNADNAEMEAAYPLVCEAFERFKKEAEEYLRSKSAG